MRLNSSIVSNTLTTSIRGAVAGAFCFFDRANSCLLSPQYMRSGAQRLPRTPSMFEVSSLSQFGVRATTLRGQWQGICMSVTRRNPKCKLNVTVPRSSKKKGPPGHNRSHLSFRLENSPQKLPWIHSAAISNKGVRRGSQAEISTTRVDALPVLGWVQYCQ